MLLALGILNHWIQSGASPLPSRKGLMIVVTAPGKPAECPATCFDLVPATVPLTSASCTAAAAAGDSGWTTLIRCGQRARYEDLVSVLDDLARSDTTRCQGIGFSLNPEEAREYERAELVNRILNGETPDHARLECLLGIPKDKK